MFVNNQPFAIVLLPQIGLATFRFNRLTIFEFSRQVIGKGCLHEIAIAVGVQIVM